MTLATIRAPEYARVVLPETFALWGAGRTFESYIGDFRAVAESGYGRRRRFTVGLREGGHVVCSCKLYDRELCWGPKTLRATGIGAVFTQQGARGRGYASALLALVMDEERAAGRDLAYLYSDIHPAFYERLGFLQLPSRILTLRASSLDGSPTGAVPLHARDWPAIRRCFEALEAQRPWGFRRTPHVWEWIRQRWTPPGAAGTQSVQLVVRRGRAVVAYAIGRRVLREDALVVDDYAFQDAAGRALIPALLRAAAGDLRRVSGWLPPPVAREALPRGSVRARQHAIFMLAPLSRLARSWWSANRAEIASARSDATWSADHV